MAEHSVEEAVIALGKETTRGTAATALDVSIPADRGSEFDYHPMFVEDEKLRGVKDRFEPSHVANEGVGTLTGVPVEPHTIGYIIHGLLGDVVTTNPDTGVYEHTFTRKSGVELPSYTFYKQRSTEKKQYPLGIFKTMNFNIPYSEKCIVDSDILFKTEETSTLTTPAILEPNPFTYLNAGVYEAAEGAVKPAEPNGEIRELTLSIDNQSIAKRSLIKSADVRDIVTPEKLLVSGTFTIYFTDETLHDEFIAGNKRALWIDLEGDEFETGYNYQLTITLPKIVYKAFPYGDVDGMLAAAVAFDAYYKVSDGMSVEAFLRNAVASY